MIWIVPIFCSQAPWNDFDVSTSESPKSVIVIRNDVLVLVVVLEGVPKTAVKSSAITEALRSWWKHSRCPKFSRNPNLIVVLSISLKAFSVSVSLETSCCRGDLANENQTDNWNLIFQADKFCADLRNVTLKCAWFSHWYLHVSRFHFLTAELWWCQN